MITAGPKWPKAPRVPMRLFRSSAGGNQSDKVLPPDPKAPFLSSVNGLADFQWEQVDVAQHVPLVPDSAMETLIALKNGDPLLVRKQIGKGFVLCLTTSLDRSWSNLPAKPLFAPLMRELIPSLADPLREETGLQAWVGRPVKLRVPSGIKSVSVVSPDGIASAARISADGILEWPAPSRPGLYDVRTGNAKTDFNFAVNIPDMDQEGDLSRLDERDAKNIFRDHSLDYVSAVSNKTGALLAALQGRDLANPLLACLFILFFVETALGWKKRNEK